MEKGIQIALPGDGLSEEPLFRPRFRDKFRRPLVAILVVLYLTSLAPLMSLASWRAELLSHFVPQFAVVTTVVLVGLIWTRQARWVLLTTMMLVIQTSRLVPYFGPVPQVALGHPPQETVRIAQFNVERVNPNADRVVDWLLGMRETPDVVVLLEVSGAWREPLRRLNALYPSQRLDLREDHFGIAVFSRLRRTSMVIKKYAGSDIPAIVLHAQAGKLGVPLVLYAAHVPPPVTEFGARERNLQLSSLARTLSAESVTNRVLVGDLNVTPWSPWFDSLTRIGLRDAQHGHGYTGTWPAWLPAELGIPLDHALVYGRIEVSERKVGPRLGSDHYPVLTTLHVIKTAS